MYMYELAASNITEYSGITFRGINRNSIRISCANRDSMRFVYFIVQPIGYICNYAIANHLNLMKIIMDDLSKMHL